MIKRRSKIKHDCPTARPFFTSEKSKYNSTQAPSFFHFEYSAMQGDILKSNQV